MKDSILYIVIKALIFLIRLMPLRAWLFCARVLGLVYYFIAGKQNKKAYAHLKLAFSDKSRSALNKIILRMYQNFAQNFVEILYLPYVDEKYVQKYIKISDMSVVEEAQKNNHGVLFLGAHAGSWELSNVACGILFRKNNYAMLAQPQKKTLKLDSLLNQMRRAKGCSVISVTELKKMVEHLTQNYFLGLVADHGGKDGVAVEFFSKLAMTPIGSVRLARKLKSKIIVSYMRRVGGQYHEMLFKELRLVEADDSSQELKLNLRNINQILEGWITQYPQEYLWTYKRWKNSPQKNILILSDGKAGHVKQSQALAEMIVSLGGVVNSEIVKISYKSSILKTALTLFGFLFGPRAAIFLAPFCLTKETIKNIFNRTCDIVISTGSSLAVLNLILSYENNAKSIVIMKPGIFSLRRFNLCIVPEHDHLKTKKDAATTIGALNTVTPDSIKKDFQVLLNSRKDLSAFENIANPKVGFLIGGDSKDYSFDAAIVSVISSQIKRVIEEKDAYLFLTTSRRTSSEVARALKLGFKNDPRCKLLVIANESNPIGTIGGIFYLADVIIVSGESVSMVSESLATGKNVIVFEPKANTRDAKASRFLDSLVERNLIYRVSEDEVYEKLSWVLNTKPERVYSAINQHLLEILKKVL